MGQLKRGDVDAAFTSADQIIEGKLQIGGQEHFYMETNGARVVPKEDGEIEVFIGCQGPAIAQVMVNH
jgi:xanthine dehydrogenase molybdopterin-binding subunit B